MFWHKGAILREFIKNNGMSNTQLQVLVTPFHPKMEILKVLTFWITHVNNLKSVLL